MDKEALVNEIRATLTSFIKSKFNINMAMLLNDVDHDTYTFVLSSYFLDLLNPYDGIRLVAEYFYENLSREAFAIISRINIINTQDPTFRAICGEINFTNVIAELTNCQFFNVLIKKAILLEAHRN